jgi:neurofibromin 1
MCLANISLRLSYDTLVPRMTAVLATTSNTSILSSVTAILERALADTNYSFPSAGILSSESMSSLHQKSYSASISSVPSVTGLGIGGGMGGSNGGGGGGRAETVLEDMGMKGLAELSFPHARMER